MTADKNDFEETLARILQARIPGCKALVKVDRLSGGASQETYRIVINTAAGEQLLAMRRAPGGIKTEPVPVIRAWMWKPC